MPLGALESLKAIQKFKDLTHAGRAKMFGNACITYDP